VSPMCPRRTKKMFVGAVGIENNADRNFKRQRIEKEQQGMQKNPYWPPNGSLFFRYREFESRCSGYTKAESVSGQDWRHGWHTDDQRLRTNESQHLQSVGTLLRRTKTTMERQSTGYVGWRTGTPASEKSSGSGGKKDGFSMVGLLLRGSANCGPARRKNYRTEHGDHVSSTSMK
jgi:hypothetical protein